jgi:hypothetical protein
MGSPDGRFRRVQQRRLSRRRIHLRLRPRRRLHRQATGGTVAAATYFVVLTYTDGLGDTVISGETSVTTSGATASVSRSPVQAASTGALTWNAYCGTTTGGPYFPQGTGLTIGSNRVVTTTPPTTGTQPRGVDRSLATTRFMVLDNSTITATTAAANSNVITFTGYNPTGADVGNIFRTTAGTNINVNVYEITAVTSTTWTVTGAVNLTTAGGAGSAIVGGMGGCFASPGQACGVVAVSSGNLIFLKAGTYTIANGTNNTAGNKFTTNGFQICGYSTNRYPGNTDTKPVLDAGAASMIMASLGGNGPGGIPENLSFTNSAARASVTAIALSTVGGISRNISISGCTTPITFSQAGKHARRLLLHRMRPGHSEQRNQVDSLCF